MRNGIKRLLIVLLAICLFFSAVPVKASALSLKEQSWVERLNPRVPRPDGGDSFPAHLYVDTQKFSIAFIGTCSLEGDITDEDKLDVLKQAAASMGGYNDPEDAVNDVRIIEAVKYKLSFTQEDMDHLIDNWTSLAGVDKIYQALTGKVPKYGGSDAVGMSIELFNNVRETIKPKDGLNPNLSLSSLSPIPLGFSDFAQGFVINGAFITWDEFWADQERWKDIVNMYKAKERLRQYDALVREKMKKLVEEKQAWTIRINDQIVQTYLYRPMPPINAPAICTCDVVLKKQKDEDLMNITGTYVGDFKFKLELDLGEYDAHFHAYLAKALNDGVMSVGSAMGAGIAVSKAAQWAPISQTVNQPSENKFTMESHDLSVKLSLPTGVRRGIIEVPVDTMKLEMTEYLYKVDMVSVVQIKSEGVTDTLTWTEIENSDTGAYFRENYSELVDILGNVTIADNPESGTTPKVDVRPYIKMRIVVDMVNN